jgi:membrane fusion protein, copper/silver efflux system
MSAFKTLLALALVATGLFFAYRLGQQSPFHEAPSPTSASSQNQAVADAALLDAQSGERVILYYRNPMGLPDTSPVPKKDSMGMDYIPVYADENTGEAGVVRMDPSRIQTLGVKTAYVEKRLFESDFRALGRIEVNEAHVHEISPRFEGWIERLHVPRTGDAVHQGQALLTAYSPEMASALEEWRIAQDLLGTIPEKEDPFAEAARELVRAARMRLDNAQARLGPSAQRTGVSQRVQITSPVTGVVLEKPAVEGMRFGPGTPLYRIADLSTVWVMADIHEQDLFRLRQGLPAKVRLDAYPDRVFEGAVQQIYPTMNATNRTTPVRIELPNPEGLIKPGAFAHVAFSTGAGHPRLSVPALAILDTGQSQVVLVAKGEGRFKPQPVQTGLRMGEWVEIREGVAEHEQVVVSANFLIDAESQLQAALAQFTAPEEKPARYGTQGRFEGFFADTQTVLLMHEPIEALGWPAMTMEFHLSDPALVSGLKEGTPIAFDFEDRGNGQFVVIQMTPVNAKTGGQP